MNSQVLTSNTFIQSLQLSSEVPPLDVEVKDSRVIHQDTEGSICQVSCALSENLVQHGAVGLSKGEELLSVRRHVSLGCSSLLSLLIRVKRSLLLLNMSQLLLASLLLVDLLLLLGGGDRGVDQEEGLDSWLEHEDSVMIRSVRQFLETIRQC